MTSSPRGFDLFLADAALVEVAFLEGSEKEALDLLLRLPLDDPTEDNPIVQNLSNGDSDSVYAFAVEGLTVVYQFVNPLIIQIIHISPIPYEFD